MRKLLCIILTVVLMAGMTMGAGAAVVPGVVTTGIKAVNESKAIDYLIEPVIVVNDVKDSKLTLDDLAYLEVVPGDVIKIPLSGPLFLDAKGAAFNQADVSFSALNSAGISVRSFISKGEGTYTVSLDGNKSGSYIKIEFAKGIYLTPQKFSSYITLTKGGSRKMSTRINISGQMQTYAKELNAGSDYADLSDGSFVQPTTFLRNVELYLGDYCSITRSLLRGTPYAGVATVDDINNQDLAVFKSYPGVQLIYKLKTVGLKTSGNIVTFDLDRKYHVYNSKGEYLGVSNQALPYWTRYYLSTKKYDKLIVS